MQSTFELHRSEAAPIINQAVGNTLSFIGPAFTAGTVCIWHNYLKAQNIKILFGRWVIAWTPGESGVVQLVSMESGGPGSPQAVANLEVAGYVKINGYNNPTVSGEDITDTLRKDYDRGEGRFYAMRCCGASNFPIYSSWIEIVWDIDGLRDSIVAEAIRTISPGLVDVRQMIREEVKSYVVKLIDAVPNQ